MDKFDNEGDRNYMVDSLRALCSLVDSALKRTEDFLPLPGTETTMLRNIANQLSRLNTKIPSQMPRCLSPRKLRSREDVDVEVYKAQKRAAEAEAKLYAKGQRGDEGRQEKPKGRLRDARGRFCKGG